MYTVLGHCPLGGCKLLPGWFIALICSHSNWQFLVLEGVRTLLLCAHDLQQCAFGASRDLNFVWCFPSLSWPRIMFSKRICFFICRDICFERDCFESSGWQIDCFESWIEYFESQITHLVDLFHVLHVVQTFSMFSSWDRRIPEF